MKRNLYLLLFIFLFTTVYSQEQTDSGSPATMNGSLDQQFEYVLQKSNNFQEYKVVKKDFLLLLKKNSIDSSNRFKKELIAIKEQVASHDNEVKILKDTLATTKVALEKLQSAQNSILFLGAPVSKTNYNLIMWGIVVALFLFLFLLFFQMRNAKATAKEAKEASDKIESDFEDYKQKALEKEQKLGRQLQDEINKHKASK
ncbi:tRNA (guanine-N1)-methyltransferase [Flavobacterium sp. UBA6135]|uniref:tRNA (guanine-N1)-methyltransferase n=1 Tax=Flavobacterium sp. UBA6135 TaxID=1946553 RepID=UPI0025C525D8|nr:tRNA (guanine-N1)-methyltransferase [Flavobacterium sp. UBA6135]